MSSLLSEFSSREVCTCSVLPYCKAQRKPRGLIIKGFWEQWGNDFTNQKDIKKATPNDLAKSALSFQTRDLCLGILSVKASDGWQPLSKERDMFLGRLACGNWKLKEQTSLSGWWWHGKVGPTGMLG